MFLSAGVANLLKSTSTNKSLECHCLRIPFDDAIINKWLSILVLDGIILEEPIKKTYISLYTTNHIIHLIIEDEKAFNVDLFSILFYTYNSINYFTDLKKDFISIAGVTFSSP